MKKLILSGACLLQALIFSAQVRDFHRIKISDSECSILSVDEKLSFEKTFSPDGAVVWTSEARDSNYAYVAICVKFAAPLGMDQDGHAVMAISYLDFLRGSVGITKFSEPQSGYTLGGCKELAGVSEQWTDATGQNYEVRAWCDENYMSVMMVYANMVDVADPRVMTYLESFRYPGCN